MTSDKIKGLRRIVLNSHSSEVEEPNNTSRREGLRQYALKLRALNDFCNGNGIPTYDIFRYKSPINVARKKYFKG